MGKNRGLALIIIIVGVLANNFVYLQDLWFGQDVITLESWKAYVAIIGSLGIIAVGLVLVARADGAKPGY